MNASVAPQERRADSAGQEIRATCLVIAASLAGHLQNAGRIPSSPPK